MLNFLKSKSLFNDGMKVLTYSEKKLESEQVGWYRSGEEIAYYQNNYRRESMTNYQRCYYTFTFTYKFEHDFDTVYFAYSQPYSYSDLMDDISEIEKRKLDYVARNTLCRTLAGNRCDYLTITTRTNFDNEDRQLQKKGVVISARVHPGESNSSWIMKGVIDFLIGDSKEAKQLRDNFVFKIIPMLNPDGVINGNYRCSLAGCDLNRRWKYPSPVIHPTIFNAKQLVK
jgi:murein tripeptide amidase MpaA